MTGTPTRMRTLFQTFDAARFDDRNSRVSGLSKRQIRRLEREDMAMARAEALGAIMFGHEVVIPAGAVADSPAFVELFGEIMEPSVEERNRIALVNGGRRYNPFRIGFEPRFASKRYRNRRFKSEYDYFVYDYLRNAKVDAIDRKVLDAIASNQDRDKDQTMLLIGHAYLDRRIDDIAAVDEGYARHVEWIARLFGTEGLMKVPPIFSQGDQFKRARPDLYFGMIRSCFEILEKPAFGYSGAIKIREAALRIKQRLTDTGRWREAAQRGVWYKNGQEFGAHWPIVRNWLDRRISDMFMSGYDVALPSYYSQPLPVRDDQLKAAFAYVGEWSTEEAAPGRAGPLLPQRPLKVDWKAVFDILSQPEVQRAQNALQSSLQEYHAQEARDLTVVRHAHDDQFVRRQVRANETARAKHIDEALQTYAAIINKGQSKIRLSRTGSRAVFAAPDAVRLPGILSKAGGKVGGAVVGAGAPNAAVALWPALAPLKQLGFGSDVVSNLASDGLWMGAGMVTAKVLGHVVRGVATPAIDAYQPAEKARLSVWMTKGPRPTDASPEA